MRLNRDGEQNLYRLSGLFSLVIVFGISLNAGSFEDFKKQQFEAYTKFKDENDAAFSKYLKQQWEAYEKFVSKAGYKKPKPKKIQKAIPKPVKEVGPKIVIKTPPPPKPKKIELPKEIVVVKPQKEDKKEQTVELKKIVQKDVNFDFFGLKVGLDIPKEIKKARFYPQSKKGIENFFASVATSNYKPLLDEIRTIKKSLNLNDWGLYLLVTDIGKNIYHRKDEQKLFNWFVMNKLGYAVKVGLSNRHIVDMYYSKDIIYSTPNFRFKNKRYYVLSNFAKGNVGRVLSYRQDYPGSTKPIDMRLKSLPNFPQNRILKTVNFRFMGKTYTIDYVYNQNLVDFYKTYPTVAYSVFFNSKMDELTYNTLVKSLKEKLNGKKASYGLNFLLAFVQKSFKYQIDQEQFGREKIMFPEETLYFERSDCEDRAILYSRLVKDIFGINVVGVRYFDHMTTALYVPLDGDKIVYNQRKFVLADPTYINANVGEEMPKYKKVKPEEVILVKR